MKRAYPKEREKKLNETIKTLRAELRSTKKKLKILEQEFTNILKPVRKRKSSKPQVKKTSDQWRENFVAEIKANLATKKEE